MSPYIFSAEGFIPLGLSPHTQGFIRITGGLLMLGTLLWALPHGRRFFLSERWGGYGESGLDVDCMQNPYVYPFVMALWLFCGICITVGWWSVWAALVNLLLCRYYFVRMRWKGILRGMGAPGAMSYWMATGVFLLEFTYHYALDLQPLAVLVMQIDFALIMFSAGFYKFTAGYPQNTGFQLGLVNPEWSYWPEFYKKFPPGHWFFRVMNHLAWASEIIAAVLMIVPQTRFIGGAIIMVSFAFIATQIRLGFLAEVVILACVFYVHPNCLADQFIRHLVSPEMVASTPTLVVPDFVVIGLKWALLAYLILLPISHAGLFLNFYCRRSLPKPIQNVLEAYTKFFGIIIWRVFSVDIINFFILIYHESRSGSGERTLLSRYGHRGGLRYAQVAESITITSLFTTLKYYPSNSEIFRERILRYARTVPHPDDYVLVFEYVSIQEAALEFEYLPVSEYRVDVHAGTVEEKVLTDVVSVRAAHTDSPVFEGSKPGSYAPLKKS